MHVHAYNGKALSASGHDMKRHAKKPYLCLTSRCEARTVGLVFMVGARASAFLFSPMLSKCCGVCAASMTESMLSTAFTALKFIAPATAHK